MYYDKLNTRFKFYAIKKNNYPIFIFFIQFVHELGFSYIVVHIFCRVDLIVSRKRITFQM